MTVIQEDDKKEERNEADFACEMGFVDRGYCETGDLCQDEELVQQIYGDECDEIFERSQKVVDRRIIIEQGLIRSNVEQNPGMTSEAEEIDVFDCQIEEEEEERVPVIDWNAMFPMAKMFNVELVNDREANLIRMKDALLSNCQKFSMDKPMMGKLLTFYPVMISGEFQSVVDTIADLPMCGINLRVLESTTKEIGLERGTQPAQMLIEALSPEFKVRFCEDKLFRKAKINEALEILDKSKKPISIPVVVNQVKVDETKAVKVAHLEPMAIEEEKATVPKEEMTVYSYQNFLKVLRVYVSGRVKTSMISSVCDTIANHYCTTDRMRQDFCYSNDSRQLAFDAAIDFNKPNIKIKGQLPMSILKSVVKGDTEDDAWYKKLGPSGTKTWLGKFENYVVSCRNKNLSYFSALEVRLGEDEEEYNVGVHTDADQRKECVTRVRSSKQVTLTDEMPERKKKGRISARTEDLVKEGLDDKDAKEQARAEVKNFNIMNGAKRKSELQSALDKIDGNDVESLLYFFRKYDKVRDLKDIADLLVKKSSSSYQWVYSTWSYLPTKMVFGDFSECSTEFRSHIENIPMCQFFNALIGMTRHEWGKFMRSYNGNIDVAPLVLQYGNYGGPGTDTKLAPIDNLDHMFKVHDDIYGVAEGNKYAGEVTQYGDEVVVNNANALAEGAKGIAYALAATATFKAMPYLRQLGLKLWSPTTGEIMPTEQNIKDYINGKITVPKFVNMHDKLFTAILPPKIPPTELLLEDVITKDLQAPQGILPLEKFIKAETREAGINLPVSVKLGTKVKELTQMPKLNYYVTGSRNGRRSLVDPESLVLEDDILEFFPRGFGGSITTTTAQAISATKLEFIQPDHGIAKSASFVDAFNKANNIRIPQDAVPIYNAGTIPLHSPTDSSTSNVSSFIDSVVFDSNAYLVGSAISGRRGMVNIGRAEEGPLLITSQGVATACSALMANVDQTATSSALRFKSDTINMRMAHMLIVSRGLNVSAGIGTWTADILLKALLYRVNSSRFVSRECGIPGLVIHGSALGLVGAEQAVGDAERANRVNAPVRIDAYTCGIEMFMSLTTGAYVMDPLIVNVFPMFGPASWEHNTVLIPVRSDWNADQIAHWTVLFFAFPFWNMTKRTHTFAEIAQADADTWDVSQFYNVAGLNTPYDDLVNPLYFKILYVVVGISASYELDVGLSFVGVQHIPVLGRGPGLVDVAPALNHGGFALLDFDYVASWWEMFGDITSFNLGLNYFKTMALMSTPNQKCYGVNGTLDYVNWINQPAAHGRSNIQGGLNARVQMVPNDYRLPTPWFGLTDARLTELAVIPKRDPLITVLYAARYFTASTRVDDSVIWTLTPDSLSVIRKVGSLSMAAQCRRIANSLSLCMSEIMNGGLNGNNAAAAKTNLVMYMQTVNKTFKLKLAKGARQNNFGVNHVGFWANYQPIPVAIETPCDQLFLGIDLGITVYDPNIFSSKTMGQTSNAGVMFMSMPVEGMKANEVFWAKLACLTSLAAGQDELNYRGFEGTIWARIPWYQQWQSNALVGGNHIYHGGCDSTTCFDEGMSSCRLYQNSGTMTTHYLFGKGYANSLHSFPVLYTEKYPLQMANAGAAASVPKGDLVDGDF